MGIKRIYVNSFDRLVRLLTWLTVALCLCWVFLAGHLHFSGYDLSQLPELITIEQTYSSRAFAHQLRILYQTQQWRDLPDVPYAGYVGPWLEDSYYVHWLRQDPIAKQSTNVYLPVFWTKCHKHCTADMKSALQHYIDGLDRSFTYYTVVAIGKGLSHHALKIQMPADLNIIVYSAGGCSRGDSLRNVIVPLVKDVPPKSNQAKTKEVSFIGKFETHPVRNELRKMFGSRWSFSPSNPRWAAFTESSHFTLCPRGFGPTSFRLAEAIHLDSIPIYVWEGERMLPWARTIPWDRMAITVHRSEIASLPALVAQFNRAEALSLIRQYKDTFTLEATCAAIQSHINQVRDYHNVEDECAAYPPQAPAGRIK
jgi:hypothetical protein